MPWESETDLRKSINNLTQALESEMMNLSHGASEPSEDMLTVMVELEDLHNELQFLRDNRAGSDEPDALVFAPPNPLPHLNSGTIALPEPDGSQH